MKYPQVIQDNGFGGKLEKYKWDNKKVWALNIPVEIVPIEEVSWIFDFPFWTDGNEPYNLKPIDVINNPEVYPEHHKRLANCDTSFPIDVMKNKKGKWLILDGLHRLVKLHMDGHKTVQVRKLSRDLIPQILKLDL